jgi:hypothetical protein
VATTASARLAAFPAVFIGGRLVGGLDRLMAMHIAGELVPVLKQAGALAPVALINLRDRLLIS